MSDLEWQLSGQLDVIHPIAGVGVLAIIGEHDLSTSGRVAQSLSELIEHNRIVVADLTEATFIDSSIIKALARADKRASKLGVVFRLELGDEEHIVHTALRITGVFEELQPAPRRPA